MVTRGPSGRLGEAVRAWATRPALALGLASFASQAWAAPPPPPVIPPELRTTIDGYDVGVLYGTWVTWIERQKGPVVVQLAKEIEQLSGRRVASLPFIEFSVTGERGTYVAGAMRVYCPEGSASGDWKDCHYRFRKAYVDMEANAYGQQNPLSSWARDAFDGPALIAHLRASGIAPVKDWWRADMDAIFSAMPAPAPTLRRNATIITVDSRGCPALHKAVQTLESRRLNWRADLSTVGDDAGIPPPPPPHSSVTTFSLRLRAPGGSIVIEGDDDALKAAVRPALDAAWACEQAQRKP